jgi:hypothetical protein
LPIAVCAVDRARNKAVVALDIAAVAVRRAVAVVAVPISVALVVRLVVEVAQLGRAWALRWLDEVVQEIE